MGTGKDERDILEIMQSLGIPKNHLAVAKNNLNSFDSVTRSLLVHKRLPDKATSDLQIERILLDFSSLDTNNFSKGCGVGEREGRVFSSLVQRRHYHMSHGIGRSGDIVEPQPKAAGSSVIYKLTTNLALDVIRRGSGLAADVSGSNGKMPGPARDGILLPLCTGMSMTLTLQALKSVTNTKANVILWSRIDQKSCFKAIMAASCEPVIIPTKTVGDNVVTDVDAMKAAMETYGNRILAVITTTSAFAPRVPDSVDQVAKLCNEWNVNHVINNAYGLQCEKTCKLINRACVVGRVDAIVMSTDKNFLVPVGGALVLSPNIDVVKSIGKIYPGRANGSPVLDLFITLLSLGLDGYKNLLKEREKLTSLFIQKLEFVAEKYGERILKCDNSISYGMTLNNLQRSSHKESRDSDVHSKDISYFGSLLFTRCISGTRVVPKNQNKSIAGYEFDGFGSSTCNYSSSYLTAACAIGLTKKEMEDFFIRLDKALNEYHRKLAKK